MLGKRISWRKKSALTAFIAGLFSLAPAQAQLQWDQGLTPATPSGGTGNWSTAINNWSDGANDVAWDSQIAVFGGTAGTVTLTTPVSATGLTFNTTGYTIAGTSPNILTLTGSGLVTANQNATISAIIAGSAGLTKEGTGKLTLSGVNTFTNGLNINAGTVGGVLNTHFGAGPINLNGGTLQTNETAQMTLGAAQIINVGASGGTIDNPVNFKLLLNTAGGLTGSGTLTRIASANPANLANIFQISVANTGFTGGVVLNGGVTEVSTNGLGDGTNAANTVTVNTGGELAANGNFVNKIIANGGIIGGDGGNRTLNNTLTANGAFTFRLGDFFQATNRNLTVAGNMSGTGTFNLIGAQAVTAGSGQVLTLSGDNSAYSANINVPVGYNVAFGAANSYGTGTLTVQSNATSIGGIGVNYDFAATPPTIINSRTGTTTGGVFAVNTTLAATTSLNMNTLGGGGMLLGTNSTATYASTTLGADAGVYRLGGGGGTLTLPNATLTGANSLTVNDSRTNGGGTVVLTGANTFDGAVSVNNGTLTVATINSVVGGTATSNLGAPTSAANGTLSLGSIAASGTLNYTGPGETTDRNLSLPGTSGGGTITNAGTGFLKFTGTVTVAGTTKTLNVGTPSLSTNVELTGTINSTSLIVNKTGSGMLTLSGTGNTVQQLSGTGGIINVGPNGLTINNGGAASIANTGHLTVNGNLVLGGANGDYGASLGGSLTLNGVLSGANAIDFYNPSAGITFLNGANTYSGATNIQQQIVVASSLNSVTGGTSSSSLGAPTTVGAGTIAIAGSANSTLRYVGTGETTDRVVNLAGTTFTGTLDQSGTGLLKFTSNFTATGAGIKVLGLSGSTAGTGEISGAIANNSTTNTTGVTKTGTGTWTLSGANTYTGATTVSGGTLNLTGTFATTPVSFGGTGTMVIPGLAAGGTRTFGALTFAAGSGTLNSTYGGTPNTQLTVASLARTAGATGNFLPTGGINGTDHKIVITGATANTFLNVGTYYAGSAFAWYDSTAYVRGINYGSDTGAVTSGATTSLASATHQQTTGAISDQASATFTTLNLAGTDVTPANNSMVLTTGATVGVNSILKSGGSGATISGGTSLTTAVSGQELIVRTDLAADTLTISTPILASGTNALVKSGAGVLTLSAANTFTGSIYVNEGVLAASQTNAATTALGGQIGTTYRQMFFNGGTFRATGTWNNNVPSATNVGFVFNIQPGGATLDVNSGFQLTIDDGAGAGTGTAASQLQGSGDIIKTGAGVLSLGNGTSDFAVYTGRISINAGTVYLGTGANQLGSPTYDTTVNAGGTLDGRGNSSGELLVINGGSLINGNTGTSTFSAPISVPVASTIGGAANMIISNTLTGSGNITKTGAGTATISGYGNNTGTYNVTGGTLAFARQVSLYNNTPASWNDTNLTIGSGAALQLNVGGAGEFTGSDVDTIKALGTATGGFLNGSRLALDSTNATSSVGITAITNTNGGANAIGFTKLGTGTVTATGASTYTGTTILDQGTLAFNGSVVTNNTLFFGASAGRTVVSNLDLSNADATFTTVTAQTNSATANTVVIGAGKQMNIGSFTVGFNTGSAMNATPNTQTFMTMSGLGTLNMGTAASVLTVGVAETNQLGSNTNATLDVSGLASVKFGSIATPITTINVAFGQTNAGTILLSNTANTLAATTLNIGHSNGSNGGPGVVRLGTGTNLVNADTINIGFSKVAGTLSFASQAASSPGTVTIGNKAGTGGAAITVGSQNGNNTGAVLTGTLDLRGHNSTVVASTLNVGINNNSGGTGSARGIVSFDTGTFSATTLNLGTKSSSGTGGNSALTPNQLNIGGGAFTVSGATTIANHTGSGTNGVFSDINLTGGSFSTGTLVVAVKNGSSAGSSNSNINVSGGTFSVTGATFTLGSQANTGTSVATLNITGGTVSTQADILKGVGPANTTSSIVLDGGTLNMNGKNIGNATASINTLTLASGTLNAVNQINNGAAVSKTTTGTLTYTGTNAYSGATTVAEGKLLVNGSLTNSAVTVNGLATLGGSGTIGGATIVDSTGIVAPGNSAGNLTFGAGADLSTGGVYRWELGALSTTNPGTDFDTITVSGGNLALGGSSALTLDFGLVGVNGPNSANAFWTTNQSWKIVDVSGTGTNTGDTNLSTITNATYTSGSFTTTVGTGGDAGDIFLVFTANVVGGPSVWQGTNNDPWTAAGSWTGSVPNSTTAEAKFVSTGGITASLDANQTVNKLTFDSTNPHTISGSNTLTLAGTSPTISTAGTNNSTQTVAVNLDLAAGTAISVQGGTLELNSPANAVLGAGVTATVATGATLSLGGAGNALSNGTSTHANVNNSGTLVAATAGKRVGDIDGATGTTTVTAAGATLIANHIRQSTLNIGAGNTVTVAANGGDSGVSVVTNLNINATGKIDLTNNDLVVDNGNLTTLTAQLASGLDILGSYGSGPGINGITSSSFANDPNFNTVLGIASNADLGYATFSGQTVDSNDVLIKYTYFGDADLNGVVDGATDFDLYITGLTSGGSLGGWLFGDFDYNGSVDSATDFDLYITGLSSQGGPLLTGGGGSNLVQAVPEPSTFVLGGLALLGFAGVGLRRRRQRHQSKC